MQVDANKAEGGRLKIRWHMFFGVCQESAIMRYLTGDGQKYGHKIPAEKSLDRTSLNDQNDFLLIDPLTKMTFYYRRIWGE